MSSTKPSPVTQSTPWSGLHLSQVVLDIDAQAGAGKLLGTLLCAVVSLLDGPALLTAISSLLEQINAILGALA